MNNTNQKENPRESLNSNDIYVVERTPDMGVEELVESIREKIQQVLSKETDTPNYQN